MKILITVDPEIPVPPTNYGGIERIVEMLINQLVLKGHEVTLCAHPSSKVPCNLVGWRGAKSQVKLDLIRNTIQLTSLVATNKYDIIHSFSRLAYLVAVLPTSIPKIMSYQREPTLSQVKKAKFLAKGKSLLFTGCSNYISDKISTVTTSKTVYNCAPFSKYVLESNLENDAPLIFLGRIEPIKGTDIAVKAALQSNRRLIIAGNIPEGYETYFDEQVKPFLSDRIQYIGPVDDSQKNYWLGKSLALLMPITWDEPFGIVMAEAMACGTPVIGFRRGSVPEVVKEGATGFIVDSLEEMVTKIVACEEIDRTMVRKISESRFSDDKISNDYLALYEKMVQSNNSQS